MLETLQIEPSSSQEAMPAAPGPGGVELELARFLPRIGMMGMQLKETSAQIEESVVTVCESFQDIAERARVSTCRNAGLLGSKDTEGENSRSFEMLLETCDTTIVTLLQASTDAGATALNAVERMGKIDVAAQQINTALQQLEHIAQGNKILALNARIEAAHSGESGFGAVAVELASQTARSRTVTSHVGDLIQQMSELAGTTLADLQKMQQENADRVQQCRAEVNETLSALRAAHRQMQALVQVANDDSALLAADIGSAIRGLQFQDRVSQRLAHVVEDLNVMQTRLTPHVDETLLQGMRHDDGFSNHVMHEEHAMYGLSEQQSAEGDIELF